MGAQKLTLESPKKVKRLKLEPTKRIVRVSRLDDEPRSRELHKPANDEVIEIDLGITGLKMVIRPVDSIVAQISYEPGGNTFEEEIYAFLWVCESQNGWRFWDTTFSNSVIDVWKKITKDL